MKKFVFSLFFFSALFAVAQNKSTIETKALIRDYSKAKSVEGMSQTLLSRLPIRQTPKGPAIGVLAKVDNRFDAETLKRDGIDITSRVADIVAMNVPLHKLESLESVPGIVLFSVAHRAAPMMDDTRFDTHTDSIQAGVGVPMPFNGSGVLIGITDWGFDYRHPNLNPKSNPRILRAWDQFKLSGPAPQGFDYGTEYKTYDELRAANCDTAGLYGYATHGTHVAGICGGKGTSSGQAIGQAPGAQFLLGSWYLDEPSWLDQVAWMYGVAKSENKRLVINSSWGMYTFSTLDGTSLLSQAINSYSDSGVVFVTSGGNNGDVNYHIQHTFESDVDTLGSVASYYGSGIGQGLIYWGEPYGSEGYGNFKAAFALVNKSDNSQVYFSPMFNTADDIIYTESYIVAGSDTIHYDIMTESANPLDNRPHALLNVGKNNDYNLVMLCYADSGTTVNVWNMANIANGAGNMGCNFTGTDILSCISGDYYYGIGEPACAEKTISVAAHDADRIKNGVFTPGTLAYFSSYGPTLDGRMKPEISAPGYNVVSSVSSWSDELSNYPAVYEAMSGGRRYTWARMSGTSMSSPAVTGIVALMLQANPYLTVDQIREIIFTTARNDNMTGPLIQNDSMSIRWGHGKIDALRAVNAAYDKLSVSQAAEITPQLVVFPNPTADFVTVRTGSNMPQPVEIFTIDGRKVMQTTLSGENIIDLSSLSKGVYFLRVSNSSSIRTAKIVKN